MKLPLKTRRLELRELESDDFSAVHACTSDPLIAQWFPWGPNSEQETRDFVEGALRGATQRPRKSYVLSIVSPKHGFIGVSFLNKRGVHELELGYYLHRDHWNQGFATEAVQAVAQFALRELGTQQIFARVDPANAASARVLEHVGFQLDRTASRDRFVEVRRRDSLVYALRADK